METITCYIREFTSDEGKKNRKPGVIIWTTTTDPRLRRQYHERQTYYGPGFLQKLTELGLEHTGSKFNVLIEPGQTFLEGQIVPDHEANEAVRSQIAKLLRDLRPGDTLDRLAKDLLRTTSS